MVTKKARPAKQSRAQPPEALLYEKLSGRQVQCRLCSHYCLIADGKVGFCMVRRNEGGKLSTLSWGKAAGLELDPIEKKPFFHFHPGAQKVLSFGTPGCNFRCIGCQNWDLSQAPRLVGNPFESIPTTTPKQIVDAALDCGADGFAYTYTEPTVFFEYARDTIRGARKRMPNAFHTFVSNGYFSRECFERIRKERLLDAIRIDLKFIDEGKHLRYTGAHLKPVQESIKRVYAAKPGIHLELINLVVPGWNDDDDALRRTAEWIAGVGKDIPVHFIRFFPMYGAVGIPATDERRLLKAKKIGEEAGLEYVYAGNTLLAGAEDTLCPNCGKLLIKRSGMAVLENVWEKMGRKKGGSVGGAGKKRGEKPLCPKCGREINLVL